MPRTLTWLALAAALTTALGCAGLGGDPQAEPSPQPPCSGNPAASTNLGYPARDTAPAPAYFDTAGGALHIIVHDYGARLIVPVTSTTISIGPAATPPTFDQRRSIVGHATVELSVKKGRYGTVDLPAGRYWLLASNGGDVEIVSCTPGGVTGTPPPPRYTLPPSDAAVPSPSHS